MRAGERLWGAFDDALPERIRQLEEEEFHQLAMVGWYRIGGSDALSIDEEIFHTEWFADQPVIAYVVDASQERHRVYAALPYGVEEVGAGIAGIGISPRRVTMASTIALQEAIMLRRQLIVFLSGLVLVVLIGFAIGRWLL